jgi:amino acid permease
MGLDAAAGEPHGTRLSTIVSVIANLVGAGLLSLPFTFKRAGIVPGAVSMCLMAGLNAFSMMIIARCCELSGVFTYKGIGEKALGGVSAKVITAIMALYTLGSCVSFVVLLVSNALIDCGQGHVTCTCRAILFRN